jgi:23S rRNA pseudouridine2605 synthase
MAHPRYEVPRVYMAKVRGVPGAPVLERLRRGVRVEGERLGVDSVRVVEADNNAWLELTLHEGKQHELRRLLRAVGHPVSKLRRVAFGPLTLRGLKPGEFRHLAPQEVQALQRPARSGARPLRSRRTAPRAKVRGAGSTPARRTAR